MTYVSAFLRLKSPSASALLTVSGGLLTAATYVVHKTSLQQKQDNMDASASAPSFQIETDLMERIAQKPYLQAFTSNDEYPRGVPHRLRVLAIDVPEMRTAFDGECRINLSKIYADEIAPPKDVKDNKFRVAQKSLAKSLIKCRKNKKIGVEMLEASVADLNPYNMRKTHQFGNLINYDPGKYATRSKKPNKSNQQLQDEKTTSKNGATTERPSTLVDSTDGSVLATDDDEVDAPWNQYAWIEEMQLRVNGKVPFGSTLHASSALTRILNGNVYKTTIPSNRAFWEWFLPPFLHRDPAGREGNRNNWASHKPHAVIADGAAMQRVPGSMKFLQRTCQEANVPLFIVNDPRVWGGNTHQDLEDALRDMRKTIKYNIVQESMRGSAFSRGRLLGQLETEAKWQAKDTGRRTRELVKDVNRRLQQERLNDWSSLSADELTEKLLYHKAIAVHKREKGEVPVSTYTDGLKELARRCVASQSEHLTVQQDEATVDSKVPVDAVMDLAPPATT